MRLTGLQDSVLSRCSTAFKTRSRAGQAGKRLRLRGYSCARRRANLAWFGLVDSKSIALHSFVSEGLPRHHSCPAHAFVF